MSIQIPNILHVEYFTSRDDSTTYNIAVLLVHESDLCKHRRHLKAERERVIYLKKQMEAGYCPELEENIHKHEVSEENSRRQLIEQINIENLLACIEQDIAKEKDREKEIDMYELCTSSSD